MMPSHGRSTYFDETSKNDCLRAYDFKSQLSMIARGCNEENDPKEMLKVALTDIPINIQSYFIFVAIKKLNEKYSDKNIIRKINNKLKEIQVPISYNINNNNFDRCHEVFQIKDLLLKIVSYVPICEKIGTVNIICKDWFYDTQDAASLGGISPNEIELVDEHIKLKELSLIKKVNLTALKDEYDGIIVSQLGTFENVEVLIRNINVGEEKIAEDIVSNCYDKLRVIRANYKEHLSEDDSNDFNNPSCILLEHDLPVIEEITISNCFILSFHVIGQLLIHLSLVHITVQGLFWKYFCENGNFVCLATLIIEGLHWIPGNDNDLNKNDLNINYAIPTDKQIDILCSKLPRLNEVALGASFGNKYNAFLNQLSIYNKELKSIGISVGRNDFNVPSLAIFPKLESFKVKLLDGFNKQHLANILSTIIINKNLGLENSPTDLIRINKTNLKYLELYFNEKYCDRGIVDQVLYCLKEIRWLSPLIIDIHNLQEIEYVSFNEFIDFLQKLSNFVDKINGRIYCDNLTLNLGNTIPQSIIHLPDEKLLCMLDKIIENLGGTLLLNRYIIGYHAEDYNIWLDDDDKDKDDYTQGNIRKYEGQLMWKGLWYENDARKLRRRIRNLKFKGDVAFFTRQTYANDFVEGSLVVHL